jgi:uncharacterized protein (TIGR02001 family)
MNQKITKLLLSALTLGVLSVSAQTPAPAPAPTTGSWTLTPSFASQYMFRGARLGGPSFEPTVEYDYGALAVGVWANYPMRDKVAGQSDPEIDPYGSYTFELSKELSIQPGFTFYNYPDADKSAGFYKSTFEPSVALNWTPAEGLKLQPKIYQDVVLKQTTLEFNASYVVPWKDAGTELDLAATYGTFKAKDAFESTSPAMKNYGNYWLIGASVPFQIVKDTQKLTLGVAFTKGSDNFFKQGSTPKFSNTAAVGRGVVTVSYAITF